MTLGVLSPCSYYAALTGSPLFRQPQYADSLPVLLHHFVQYSVDIVFGGRNALDVLWLWEWSSLMDSCQSGLYRNNCVFISP